MALVSAGLSDSSYLHVVGTGCRCVALLAVLIHCHSSRLHGVLPCWESACENSMASFNRLPPDGAGIAPDFSQNSSHLIRLIRRGNFAE